MSEEGQKKVCNAMLDAVKNFVEKKKNEQPVAQSSKTNTEPSVSNSGEFGVYKIQIAAMKTVKADMDSAELRKIGKLSMVTTNDLTKYMVGDYKTVEEAQFAKEKLKKLGYSGAFLVRIP